MVDRVTIRARPDMPPIEMNLGVVLSLCILAFIISPWWLAVIPVYALLEPWHISSGFTVKLKERVE